MQGEAFPSSSVLGTMLLLDGATYLVQYGTIYGAVSLTKVSHALHVPEYVAP